MKITHLERCTRQSCPVLTHLSQGLALPIFTTAPLWYFSGCFPLVFLGDHCTSSSLAATSLHLDPMTWDPSAPSNRMVSELLEVLQCPFLLLLFLLGLLLYFTLCLLSCALSPM